MRVLYTGKFRNGTPVPDIAKMVHYSHPEVKFKPYSPTSKGDVILSINRTMAEDKRNIRRVMYLGSVPSFHKSKHRENIGLVNHAFFISEYCKNIFIPRWNLHKNSIFLPFGPLPVDTDLEPWSESRVIDGPLQFVAVAKWYKRPYKRLKQILKLYNKFIKKEFPDAVLHIIGSSKERVIGGVNYHRKAFSNPETINIFSNSHIQLIPTPFDTGPKTIPESLHYRVPFVCSNNCAGSEYINLLGYCGIEVQTDELIGSWVKYKELDPLNYESKFVRRQLPYDDYMVAIREIVNNFEKYTSWEWNKKLNYKDQSDKLYNILKGK